jgi:N-acetyl-beta-hexosaminidase
MHLALTNDEGWRLEIQGLEELTSVGSRRCFGALTVGIMPQCCVMDLEAILTHHFMISLLV